MTESLAETTGGHVSEQPLAIGFSDLRGFSSYTAERGDREAFRLAQRFSELVERQTDPRATREIRERIRSGGVLELLQIVDGTKFTFCTYVERFRDG